MAMWTCARCGETYHAYGGEIVTALTTHNCKLTERDTRTTVNSSPPKYGG